MENPVVSGLRSRSRSKTPFLRSSCDREACADLAPDHAHKSGRKTPVKRSTPINQLSVVLERITPDPIVIEDDEVYTSPPAHRTRASAASAAVKTSDYSSEESPDRLRSTEQIQNKVNSQYEYSRVTSTSVSRRAFESGGTVADFALSPSQHSSPYNRSYNADLHRSYSPAHSACSTDSSFAEQALADVSKVTERDRSYEHLPYKLYKMAGEYWNKYPKTDYTYSRMSRDRVELAPGQVAVPNMSRRSLSQFRIHGASTSAEELEELLRQHNNAWTVGAQRKHDANSDSSGDEAPWRANGGGGYTPVRQRWLLTQWLIAVYTSVTSTVERTYDWMRGADRPYRYADQQGKPGVASRAAWAVASPLVWLYSMIRTVVTTTVTTITNTMTGGDGSGGTVARDGEYYRARAGGALYGSAHAARTAVDKRSKWPWLLLLLLPLVGYACYNNRDLLTLFVKETNTSPVEGYVAPKIIQDPDLSRRLSVLEDWIGTVDARLKYFDQKLSKIDNLEAQIESYSLKHLQQNLVQIFNINGRDGKITSDELKEWFDRHYVSKNELGVLAKEIRDRIAVDAKPQLDEEMIRKLIVEYLAVSESKQIVMLKEKIRHYVREVRTEGGGGGGGGGAGGSGALDEEGVRRIVGAMLNVYDADKTGVVDYALESAGGQVISTKCTELYQIKTKQYSILGLPVWWVYTSPRYALTPGAMPAECWAFQGFPGYLVVRTYAIIEVTGFSVEHMSKLLAADGKIESAPRNFTVYGLREELDPEPHLFGTYVYDENGTSIQHFPVQHPSTVSIAGKDYPMAYDTVELRVESNYGNPTYTCVYRFRVHGNPLTDIRRATEDSMRDE